MGCSVLAVANTEQITSDAPLPSRDATRGGGYLRRGGGAQAARPRAVAGQARRRAVERLAQRDRPGGGGARGGRLPGGRVLLGGHRLEQHPTGLAVHLCQERRAALERGARARRIVGETQVERQA